MKNKNILSQIQKKWHWKFKTDERQSMWNWDVV